MPIAVYLFSAALLFGGDIVDRIPDDLKERGTEIVETVKANPTLLTALIIIGVLTAFVFLWGVIKQIFKAAVFGGLASAGAWYWYFNIR